MKYKFFTIPVKDAESAEQELNRFCAVTRIATVEKEFIANGDKSFWAFCISYLENSGVQASGRKYKVDYREILDDKDFAIFARLRTIRKELAEKEGVPAYAIFTNEQLAAMVTNRVTDTAALRAIPGSSKARLQKYGKSFLEVLNQEFKINKPGELFGETDETNKN